jgi:hypothetical protein
LGELEKSLGSTRVVVAQVVEMVKATKVIEIEVS